MLDQFGEANALAAIGLLSGIVLGLAARLGRFCTLGAIEDWLYGADSTRLAMWGLAIGSAVFTTHLAIAFGALDLSQTAYLAFQWSPAASILGGVTFGYGMALCGNCGYGALARLGGGDLRSFVILIVMGVSAYVVMSGPLAGLRIAVFPTVLAEQPQGLGRTFGAVLGLKAVHVGLIAGAGLIILALLQASLRARRDLVFWSGAVGLSVTLGWLGTHWVAHHGFASSAIETHSFAAPIGDTLLYAMTASGASLSFGVGSVLGVVCGAWIGSAVRGHFRWEACDDPRELRRQIGGASLMGIGAVLALGCSVGQGISAFSVLALSAPIACVSIVAGAALGLRHLISGYSLAR